MYFDRFDICLAFWHFATEYHGVQGSGEYAVFGRLSRMRFRLGAGEGDKRNLSENARAILADMIRRWRRGESPVRGGSGRRPRGPVSFTPPAVLPVHCPQCAAERGVAIPADCPHRGRA